MRMGAPKWAKAPHDDKLDCVEVRPNPNTTIDEIIARDVSMFHLEQMDDDRFWIGLTIGDETQSVWLTAHKGKLYATVCT